MAICRLFDIILWKYLLLLVAVFDCEVIRFDIQGDHGGILSPNYPSLYPQNLTSYWTIHGPSKTFLQLNFTAFKVENNKKCLYDYVRIASKGDAWTKRYCGASIPPGYRSSNNLLRIVFVSDLTTVARGFQAIWKAVPLKSEDSSSPIPISQTSCLTTKTVTSTMLSCTSITSSRKSDITATQSCSCPPTPTTSSKSETLQELKATASSNEKVLKPFGLLIGKKDSQLEQQNNSLPRSCSPQTQIDTKKMRSKSIVIILCTLVVAFLLVDILLLVLWCRRDRRKSNDPALTCESEIPPLELKVIDGKVFISTENTEADLRLSDVSTNTVQGCHRVDRNDNGCSKAKKVQSRLKETEDSQPQERSRLVTVVQEGRRDLRT
eukprot:Seg2837.5 transcript_id=Seg2837.5/GoldUCD/mRNA.D3Y31 product="CUB domain-containing protein 2" protein_id=Seg2837.5/GoldUCD/D3Y31